MFSLARTVPLIAVLALLVACSDAENTAPATPVILETAELNALLAAAEYRQVVAAVRVREKAEQATDDDYMLQAEGYLALLDGIGAALALEKVSEERQAGDDYRLLRARSLLLEGATGRAATMLTARTFDTVYAYDAAILLGDILLLQNELAAASEQYSAAIAQEPGRYQAYIARAQVYLKTGDIDLAETDALAAVAQAPENSLSHYTLGTVFNRKARFGEAKTQFQRALQLYPYNVQALLGLVNIAILEGQYTEAKGLLDTVYSVSPEDNTANFFSAMLLALKGDDIAAREQLIELSFTGDDNPQTARLLGHVAYRLGDYDVALRKLLAVLDVAPFDRASRLIAVEILLIGGDAGQALELLEPMVEDLGTNDLAAVTMAADATARLSDFERAIAYTKRAIELAQAPETVLDAELVAEKIEIASVQIMKRQLASFYFSNGEARAAVSTLEEMISADPDDSTSMLMLTNLHMQQGDFTNAIDAANRLIEQFPESAAGHNALAAALHRQGKQIEALAAYDEAISMAPEYVSALKNRGMLHLERETYESALFDLRIVLDLIPDDLRTRFMYARALAGVSRTAEALDYYDELIRALPGSASILYYRSKALMDLSRFDEAVGNLMDALEINKSQAVFPPDFLEQELEGFEATIAASAETTQPKAEDDTGTTDSTAPDEPDKNR